MKITKHILWVCLAALTLNSCADKSPKTSVENQQYCLDENFKDNLEFQAATMQAVTEGIHLTGVVETNPDKVIHFISLVGGVVSKTYFSLGDEVKKGQVLADLRSTELSSLTFEQKNINTQIQVAERRLQSVQSMYEDGISSEKDLLQAQSELDIYKAERQKVTSHLNLFSASAEMGVFQIKAPTSGIITAKSIASGTQIIAEGDPLFTISDLNEVWVMVDIYATNVQHIETGMDVDISILSYPDTTFKGNIGAISQILDSDARVVKARVVLDNQDLRLKPGMMVDVIALKNKNTKAIGIPTSSLVFDNNQNFVVIYKDDCNLEIRKVNILSSNNGITFIESGLSENDQVVSKNQLLVYEPLNN